MSDTIRIKGARENNLKNVNCFYWFERFGKIQLSI